jgi:MscS family membrane protein
MNLERLHKCHFVARTLLTVTICCCAAAAPQVAEPRGSKEPAPSVSAVQPMVQEDPLGRTTPRGTVLGFLAVARRGDYQIAAEYLNARQRGATVATLGQQLEFVLDHRLPARLNELSNEAEGSRSPSLQREQELVGTIESENGSVDILLERVDRGGTTGKIWLFSRETLAEVPELYDEVSAISVEHLLPEWLLGNFLGVKVYTWLTLFVGLPALYLVLSLLNKLSGAIAGWAVRKIGRKQTGPKLTVLPAPLRLLVVAFALQWLLVRLSLPLLSRQLWRSLSVVLAIASVVWLFALLIKLLETQVRKRLERQNRTSAATLVRPVRAVINLIAAFAGLLLALYVCGVSPTAALAGLGVGGIAIALAAQKTLENMIGGASIIMDGAIRAGDFLKIGETYGTVTDVGLRSTRVRTLDRTIVTVPNGQMATMTLENFAFRDAFWFHHFIGLPFETLSSEITNIIKDIRTLLAQEVRDIDSDSLRVSLLGFGPTGFQLELFAYVSARDWNRFLELQESLLLKITDIVRARGLRIERPSQTIYLAESTDEVRTEMESMRKAVPR